MTEEMKKALALLKIKRAMPSEFESAGLAVNIHSSVNRHQPIDTATKTERAMFLFNVNGNGTWSTKSIEHKRKIIKRIQERHLSGSIDIPRDVLRKKWASRIAQEINL